MINVVCVLRNGGKVGYDATWVEKLKNSDNTEQVKKCIESAKNLNIPYIIITEEQPVFKKSLFFMTLLKNADSFENAYESISKRMIQERNIDIGEWVSEVDEKDPIYKIAKEVLLEKNNGLDVKGICH